MRASLTRYGLAMLFAALAAAVRFVLDPWFGQQLPFIAFFPAVAVSVWYAGIGPAALCGAVGLAVANYFFLEPRFSFAIADLPTIAVHLAYLTASALIILMGGIARRRHLRGLQHLEALEESEARFRHMADSAPVLIWMSDRDKGGTYFNRTWLHFTGRRLEQELGEGWIESVHPDDLGALTACADALDARRPFTTQFRLRAASGEYRWVLDTGAPRFDADGGFLGFIGSCVDINERKVAEESGAWLAAIVSASNDAIVSKTLDGRILSWNAAAERIYGYTAAEAVGESINLIIPAELRDEERTLLERLGRGERIEHFETVRVTKDGRRLDMSLSVSPVRDDTGRIVGASKVARDVTAQKRAEETLKLNEERYRAVVESQAEMLCRFRPDGTILFVNGAYARALDTTPEAVIGRDFWEFVTSDDRATIKAMLDALTPDEPEARVENRFEGADGPRWTLWTNRALRFDAAGRVLEAQSTGIDITERKQMEEALRHSEQRFARFMEHLPGLAWIKDLDGRYVYANEAAERAFGTERARLYGCTDAEIFPLETAATFRENDQLALANEAGVHTVEMLRYPDGATHHSLVSKFPIPALDGRPALVGGVAIDISERKRAEEALVESDRRKDEFLAVLGHELRNPLAPLRTGLELLRYADADSQTARVRLMMERQLLHLLRLVDDLLDVSRIGRGKLELKRAPLDLHTVIEAALEQTESLIEERRHELIVEEAPDPLAIDGDLERLTQVVANLLSNAAKYAEAGGVIRLCTCAAEGHALIRVTDAGYGIPPERLDTLFDGFTQVPEHRVRTGGGGLGVGLALAQRIVELHGGSIEAKSEGLGRGSEFSVHLPLAAAVSSGAALDASSPASPADDEGRRVLIVDDNVDAAESLRMILELQGHSALAVHDGPAALDAIESFAPAVVLLDIGLPRMDGYEVARRIRALPSGRDILICALTGWGQHEDRRRAQEAGFDEHLTKPVDLTLLATMIAAPLVPVADGTTR